MSDPVKPEDAAKEARSASWLDEQVEETEFDMKIRPGDALPFGAGAETDRPK